jgi:hypothetical protein
MRKRSWWAAAGAAAAVAALVGVVAVMSAGAPHPGEADDTSSNGAANRGDTSTSDTGTSDTGTSDTGTDSSDVRGVSPSGGGTSGDTGTAVPPPASQPGKPPQQPPQQPQPSVVAPRAQAPRPDLPLGLAIQSYEVVAPDRLSVQYATGLPGCYAALDRAYVSESGDRVLVTLRVRPVAQPSNEPCPDIAMIEDTLVRLDRPLGDRAVVDGSTGQAVTRGHAPMR